MVAPSPKPNNCRHENIYWEDLFREGKVKGEIGSDNFHWNKAYCLDCEEDKGKLFAYALQKWYIKKVEEWLKELGLTKKHVDSKGQEFHYITEFVGFVKKNNYYDVWSNLQRGKIDEDYFDAFGGQMLFWEASTWIEHLCREFAKEKQNNPEKPQPPKNKQKISELKAKIKELETKINKTPEEEQELTDKQSQLTNLTKPANNEQNDSNSWLKPTLLIGGGILLIGIIFLLVNSKKKNNH